MGITKLEKEEFGGMRDLLILLPRWSDDRVQNRAVAEKCVSGIWLEADMFQNMGGLGLIRVKVSIT